MHTETRKLHIIEAVLKTDSEAILKAIENIVDNKDPKSSKKTTKFSDLLGILTENEAEAMKQTIADNFEKINPDDWK